MEEKLAWFEFRLSNGSITYEKMTILEAVEVANAFKCVSSQLDDTLSPLMDRLTLNGKLSLYSTPCAIDIAPTD